MRGGEDGESVRPAGDLIDRAVGVIIGTAFGSIVSSLVSDVLMPPPGLLTGGWNLSGTHYPTLKAAQDAGAATLNYGIFLDAVIRFVVVALAVFMLVRAVNAVRKPAEEAKPRKRPYCTLAVADAAVRCPHCTSALEGSVPQPAAEPRESLAQAA